MHAAQDYVAVDSGDRIVFGPTTDYREARLHADRVGGVVKFAVAAAEEVKNAKFERCVQHVKRESPNANPWAVCHAQLGEANEAGHHCSVDSMTQVAQQIPGGPWKHEGAYPPGAKARVDHQKEHSVKVDGAAKTITVRYCGSHIILNCPVTGQQHLFQKTCIADTLPGKPQRGKIPAAPGIEPEKGKPFVLRVRKGRATTTEKGPFSLITDAVDAMQSMGAPGETATIYDGSKVASYRGGRAVFAFGRTRWSRA